jgi:RHS repeat-associated protein
MTRFVADVNKDAVFPRANTKSFANGWSNPYRYDGRDGVRYDLETGLYRMSVRAYDPALGRFLSRDPLNRAPLFFDDQPYVYAGDNPLINVDPSGESLIPAGGSGGSAPRPVSEPKCRLTAKPGTGKPWRPKESVRLGSRTWTLDDALRDRPGFQLAFFKVYASGWPSSWGQAEVDSTRYLVQSGRIRRSPYWSSADGGLVTDVFQAAYIHQHGGKERRGVVLEWLRFISAPNANTFWRAHNDSILLHTFDGVGQAALHMETRREQKFINTLVVLLEVQRAETGWAPIIEGSTVLVCFPTSPCLKVLVAQFYPMEYPVSNAWFNTWYGRLDT